MGFWYSNHNNMLSTLRQQSNEESDEESDEKSNLFRRNYGCGQTLVLYHSKLFINLDGNTITEDSFNNKGNGNQDFSSAHINTMRIKQTYPSPSPAPAIHTVSATPNQYHAYSNEGMQMKLIRCVTCQRNYHCPPGQNGVHCQFCNVISYAY